MATASCTEIVSVHSHSVTEWNAFFFLSTGIEGWLRVLTSFFETRGNAEVQPSASRIASVMELSEALTIGDMTRIESVLDVSPSTVTMLDPSNKSFPFARLKPNG